MPDPDLPKRFLHRAAVDTVIAFENGYPMAARIASLKNALEVERAHASARARASQDRKLTPEQRQAKIDKAQAQIDRLRALEEGR